MLCDFITAHRAELLARARSKIRGRKWPAVSDEELENGLPLFLSQLEETLRLEATPAPSPEGSIGATAGRHGGAALAAGFSVAQVVHDYGDIRQAITEVAIEKGVAISAEDSRTLNLCLDDAISGAVTEFGRGRAQRLADEEAERLRQLTHELRNLLSSASLAWGSVKSGKVAVGGSTAAIVDRSLLGLSDLIDTTLREVRLSAGTRASRRISVARLMREAGDAASLDAERRGMRLSVEGPEADVMIDADPQLLSAALFSLLQNAFEYSTPHARVTVRTVCRDDVVAIEVEDECGGLPEGNVEAFFSSFGPRRGGDRSGPGRRLSISRKAVRTFGGDITVRNLPGKGCVFSIAVPAPSAAK